MKFCTNVRLKPSSDRGEFELDRSRSKNNLAENSFALGHETHNSGFTRLVKVFCTPYKWAYISATAACMVL